MYLSVLVCKQTVKNCDRKVMSKYQPILKRQTLNAKVKKKVFLIVLVLA